MIDDGVCRHYAGAAGTGLSSSRSANAGPGTTLQKLPNPPRPMQPLACAHFLVLMQNMRSLDYSAALFAFVMVQ
ncbi:MAG: hypothetical protein JWQ23_1686 [Herminiimonas sp.]|nr:hypothetical protein [Herminiimonas sp.]